MAEFYVYIHTRLSDGKIFYVGKGRGKRAWDVRHRNRYWHNTVAKHGHAVTILHDGLTEKEAFNLEMIVISMLGLENLTNMTLGGDGPTGHVYSEKSKELMSKNKKANVTDETRLRHSEGRKKWKFSEETKDRMRRVISGRTLTPEWKSRIAEAGKVPVETLDGLKFDSAKSATEWLHANGWPKADNSSIIKCARGKLKSAYGRIWVYTNAPRKPLQEPHSK